MREFDRGEAAGAPSPPYLFRWTQGDLVMTDADPRRSTEDGAFDPLSPSPLPAGGPGPLHRQPLLRLLFVNWLIGAAVAVVLVAVVLITDTARLRSLMFASSQPWLPLLLLFFGFFVTMCSVAMGTAIMMLPGDDDDHSDGGGAAAVDVGLDPVPIRVSVEARPVSRDRSGAIR
jgi:hypothetical protein